MKLHNMPRSVIAVMLATLISLAGVALADDEMDQRFIEEFYTQGAFDTGAFSRTFLNQITPRQLRQAAADLRRAAGEFQAIAGRDGKFEIRTKTHRIPLTIARTDSGKIVGLSFKPPQRVGGSLETIAAELQEFPGDTSLTVTTDGAALLEVQAGKRMAVGSAFKIGILKALQDKVKAGVRQWEDIVRLTSANRSLPSGELRKWPEGSPLTLHSAAGVMMSASDNTATDILIDVVGREELGRIIDIDLPLKTREFFLLKAIPLEAGAWRNGSLESRKLQLARLAKLPRPPTAAALRPFDIAVEWAMSTSKLCSLMEEVGKEPLAAINPGLANRENWDFVTFKGGSELGVLNYTTRVEKGGKSFCLSLTWNGDAETDTAKITQLYNELLFHVGNIEN